MLKKLGKAISWIVVVWVAIASILAIYITLSEGLANGNIFHSLKFFVSYVIRMFLPVTLFVLCIWVTKNFLIAKKNVKNGGL